MRITTFFLLVGLVLIGAGCVPNQEAVNDLPTTPPVVDAGVMAERQDGSVTVTDVSEKTVQQAAEKPVAVQKEKMEEQSSIAAMKPYYIAYTEEQFRKAKEEKRPVLLYFWAAWCPICRAEEPEIKARVEASTVPVAGFRVNYDTEAELKKQYKIPYQHTTVILNTRGEESARFTGPVSDTEMNAAIRAAAQQ